MQPAQDISVGGRLARTLFQYTLEDADPNELNVWAPKMLAEIQKLPILADVATDQQIAGTTATLTIDRGAAQRFNIQPQQIDDTLYDAFGQREVTQYFTQLNSYFVILEVPPQLEGDVSTLPTTLREVAERSGRSAFRTREDRHRTGYPPGGEPSKPVPGRHHLVQSRTGRLARPGGPGDRRDPQRAGCATIVAGFVPGHGASIPDLIGVRAYLIAAALIAVYIILGILYEDFILPITILSTLPSAGVGALLMLMLTGTDLSVIAMIGIILLIGIVKKNGIMMVDFAIHAERNEGMHQLEAIRQACLLRFRPILMTTMAALLSGLPLMLEHGAGSELRQPLGYAMVGGLILSQALTLYTTPVIYLYMDQLRHWLAPHRRTRLSGLAETLGDVHAG